MKKLIMLVGITGAGKSFFAEKMKKRYCKCKIFSLEKLCKILYKNKNYQKHEAVLSQILHKNIKDYLKDEGVAIYDATNLTQEGRMSFLKDLPREVYKQCIVVTATEQTCVSRRHDVSTIHKQCCIFQPPTYREGWNSIVIFNTDQGYPIEEIIADSYKIEQQSCHHRNSIGDHNTQVTKEIKKISSDIFLSYIGEIHDLGKMFTRVFDRESEAHYNYHSNYGSYIIISSLNNICSYFHLGEDHTVGEQQKMVLELSFFVNKHMDLYSIETEEEFNTWVKKNNLSAKDIERLCILHKADINDSVQDQHWKEVASKFYGNMGYK